MSDEKYRETPPQRPFDLESVRLNMASSLSPSLTTELDPEDHINPTVLTFARSGRGDLGLLAPSIEFVEIDEGQKQATLHGLFGADQSKIRVLVREHQGNVSEAGYELAHDTSTDAQSIVCKNLPDSGPGSAGYLVVVADYGGGTFVESNAIPITKWKGKITYTERLPGQDPAGPGIRQITYDAFLRGDIHRPRKKPGETPARQPCAFNNVQDPGTPLQFTSGGSYTGGQNGYTYDWHGSGTIPWHSGEATVCGWHRFPPDPIHLQLRIAMVTESGSLLDVADKDGTSISKDLYTPFSTQALANETGVPPGDDDFLQKSVTWEEKDDENGKASYEASYTIPAKPISKPIYSELSSIQKIVIAELKWETLEATYPPDAMTQS